MGKKKKIRFIIQEPSVNKIIGNEVALSLSEGASLVDAIIEVDRMTSSEGKFPSEEYCSLLHMVYDPIKNRFYNQVAVTAYRKPGETLMIRDKPKASLPDGITVILIPAGGCVSEWEDVIDYENFRRATSEI
jgi:hypothetical protein